MSDTHAADVFALIEELTALECRRGALRARLEWHLRLRDMAPAPAAPGSRRPAALKTPPDLRHAPRDLQKRLLAFLGEQPDRTPRQVATALGTNYESTRQALMRLKQDGRVTRNIGGGYAIRESHAGSGLVSAEA